MRDSSQPTSLIVIARRCFRQQPLLYVRCYQVRCHHRGFETISNEAISCRYCADSRLFQSQMLHTPGHCLLQQYIYVILRRKYLSPADLGRLAEMIDRPKTTRGFIHKISSQSMVCARCDSIPSKPSSAIPPPASSLRSSFFEPHVRAEIAMPWAASNGQYRWFTDTLTPQSRYRLNER